jgi:hypothetical protein
VKTIDILITAIGMEKYLDGQSFLLDENEEASMKGLMGLKVRNYRIFRNLWNFHLSKFMMED